MNMVRRLAGVLSAGVLLIASTAPAAPFTTGITAGGSWNNVYVQGFNASLLPAPDPGLSTGTPIYLTQFQFYKSGNVDSASNVKLAIISNIFADLTGFNTSSSFLVGLSNNTVASSAPIATGDPIPFSFSSLPLV